MCPHQFLHRNVKGDTTALFLRIESAFCNQIIRLCPGWVCASYFLCPRKNPCANGNDALLRTGSRLQASERNIKELEFCFHGTRYFARRCDDTRITIHTFGEIKVTYFNGISIFRLSEQWIEHDNDLFCKCFKFSGSIFHFAAILNILNFDATFFLKIEPRLMLRLTQLN